MRLQPLRTALAADGRPLLDHLERVDWESLRERVEVVSAQRRELYRLPRLVRRAELAELVEEREKLPPPVAEELVAHVRSPSVEVPMEHHDPPPLPLLPSQLRSQLVPQVQPVLKL